MYSAVLTVIQFLSSRWGLLQLSRDTPETFQFTPSALLPVKQALFDSFKAMKVSVLLVFSRNCFSLSVDPVDTQRICVIMIIRCIKEQLRIKRDCF